MAKRGQAVRGPPVKGHKASTARKQAPAKVNADKEKSRLKHQLAEARQQLGQSLRQQTATADLLKVISRSKFDLQAVLQTLVESAARLCEADLANIWRPKGTTATFHLAASFGIASKPRERAENVKYLESIGIESGRGSIVARALLERNTIQIHDVQADPEYELSEIPTYRGLPDATSELTLV